jgi:hypothetical protein
VSATSLDPAAGGAPARRSPSLVVTGIVMLGAVFLYANPYFGSKAARWPWQYFAEATSPAAKSDLLLWVVTAIAAIVVGLRRGGLRRVGWLAAPTLLLVARCYGESPAFTAVQANEPTLAWFVAASFLGASLLLLAGRDERGRGVARALAAVGAIGIVAAYAITFRGMRSVVWHFRQDYANAWEKLFGGAEVEAEHSRKMWAAWWGTLFPMALLVLASGVAAVLSSVRGSTRGTRLAAAIGWVLLLGRWVAPVVAYAIFERERFAPGRVVVVSAELLGRTIFDAGLGLWLVASCTVVAIVRATAPSPPSILAVPEGAPA